MKRIKSIPLNLRPREKLLKLGCEALTLSELLAVLMTTGTRTQSVLSLSDMIAKVTLEKKKSNFYEDKCEITKEDLTNIGLGPHKISQILAAQEIGKRLFEKEKIEMTNPDVVYANSREIISGDKESLLCFYLNARGELLKKEVVAVGSLNKASVLPREIFSLVKELPVASIILAHNHPSGNLSASQADISLTNKLKEAGKFLRSTNLL